MKTKLFCLAAILLFLNAAYTQAQDLCKPVGWATQNGGTTGGGNAAPITVTSISALKSEASSSGAKVIYVSGTMGSGVGDRIVVSSNKTIIGMSGATINGGFDVKSANNVIIRNLVVKGPGAVDVDGVDCFTIDNSTNVWLDHLTVQDGQDGNLDIVNGSNYISVTWCKFQYTSASSNHQFSNLLGNSDSKTSDRGKIKVTMMNNWWAAGCKERMPRVRYGQVHIVNNLFDSPQASHCVRAGREADLLVESNVFRGVSRPIDLYDNDFTAVTQRNNLFISTSGNTSGSGTSFTPPYSLIITNVNNIETPIKNCAGATLPNPSSCSSCGGSTPPVNQSPSVSITAPSNNASYTAPASVAIAASASDADGSISNVQFYNGSTLLGSDASSPYSFSWTNVSAGTYTLTARATDNAGAVTTSSAITVVVNSTSNTPPSVSITAPSNNASFTAPASISIAANVLDANGSVSNVQFYNGSTLLGSDASSPYSFNWTNVPAGTYTLTARATDNAGAVTVSSAVTVVVNSINNNNNATACLTNNVDGYASLSGEGYTTTTGGAGGTIVTISTLAQLQDWVASREDNSAAEIVYINGLIEQPGSSSLVLTIKRGGNVSVIGNTADAGLKNIGLNFREYNNVIVRNLTVREVFYPNDGITIDECHHVWIDHCDLYSKNGAGIGVDTYDGLLDIKNGSHNVTISWNRLHSHKKVNLIGHTDNSGAAAIDGNIRVTFHHNYYYDVDGRNPSLRWGAAHVYNNYYKDVYDYGIAVRQGAHALLENNIYENVETPITTNKFDGEGIVCQRGNVFTTSGANSITQTDCNWWNASTLPYSYSLTSTSQLIGILTSQTGTCSLISNPPPVNQSPSVSITLPSNNASFTSPASIAISANASDADGSISNVQFYNGSTLLGSDASSPYSFSWTNVVAGTYTLTARATDNNGAVTTSSSVTITVNAPSNTAPTVSITAPSNNASFTAPAGIAISANASDADGSISNVQFYNGSTLLGSDASAPYSFSWTNVPAGTYTLTARATDNAGAVSTSSAITVSVTNPVPTGLTIQGETACTYDGILDESKNSGFNGSGYVNLDNATGTIASWAVNSASSQTISLSVRYANGSASNRNMSLRVNGVAQVSSIDFLSTGAWTTWNTVNVQISLVSGRNVLELVSLMGEGAPNIDELSFGASSVTAATCSVSNQAPSVNITGPANNSAFIAPASITISANASDADGSISSVQFYNGSTLLGSDVTSPYTFTWTNVAAGTYTLSARATDNNGAITTSSTIAVTVTSPANQPPSISLTSPVNNAGFTAPASINISANAADADGSVSNVQFYNGTNLLGSDATSPYTFTWTNVAPGTYTLSARATDNSGAVTTSSAVTVTVSPAPVSSDNILGADCATPNATIVFEVNASKRAGANSYAWWFQGSTQSITPVSGAAYKVNIETGTYFTEGEVCVGISYSSAPYYASFCKPVTLCAAPAALGDALPVEEANIGPNPSEADFTLSVSEEVHSVSVSNMNGIVVFAYGTLNEGETLQFGDDLINGLYNVTILYSSGRVEVRRIQKTL